MERWLALLYPELAPEKKKLGLTNNQRDWIKRCYSDENGIPRCHFPVWKDDKWDYCWSDGSPQANHIIPQGYAFEVLLWTVEQVNSPFNIIINCAHHHVGNGYHGTLDWHDEVVPVYHPDNVFARRHYKGKDKPTSYDVLFQARHARVLQGEKYWNVDWTEHLLQIAEERVLFYKQNHPEDGWPERRK